MNLFKTTALATMLTLSAAAGAFAQSGSDSTPGAPGVQSGSTISPQGSGMDFGVDMGTTRSIDQGQPSDSQDTIAPGGAVGMSDQKSCPEGQQLVSPATQTEPAVCR